MSFTERLAQAKRYRYSLLLMGGHLCVDMVQGGLAAVIPFLVLYNGYSYAQVSMLVFASNIASAVIQPLFGWLGDKKPRPWFMALGVFLAGLGMAGIGLLHTYWLIVAAAMLSGVGVAMLHPEGGRLAYLAVGTGKSTSMSIFAVGGQLGFCFGPVVASAALSAWGLSGTLVFLGIAAPYAIVLLLFNRRFVSFGLRDSTPEDDAEPKRDRWGAFGLVLGALSIRSIVYYGMTSFISLFVITVFGKTEHFGSGLIALFAAMGAVATLLSSLADRQLGTVRLMLGCFGTLIVSLAVFAASPLLGLTVAVIPLIAIELTLFNPPAITLGQSFVPNHLGMASGLSFGVAVCVGGVASPVLGSIGDTFGLTVVMGVLAGIAAVGLLFSAGVAHAVRKRNTRSTQHT